MIDYYALLRVDAAASEGEVRAAFRRMVKKCHPDLNRRRGKWAHRQMKMLLAAYEILSDADKRAVYDRRLSHYVDSQRDPYRDRLAARDDPESRARLILYDLLEGNEGDAIATYEAMRERIPGYDVAHHLPPKDWMDCKFLLGEGYERRKAFTRALELYEAIYHSRHAGAHYRHYLEEVTDRIRNLCCRDLARKATPEEALEYYRRALKLRLKRSQRAFVHKKMAECLYELGEREEAVLELGRAFELKPDLKGAQKICRRLGIERQTA